MALWKAKWLVTRDNRIIHKTKVLPFDHRIASLRGSLQILRLAPIVQATKQSAELPVVFNRLPRFARNNEQLEPPPN